MRRPIRSRWTRSRSLRGVAITAWLLALSGPSHARVEDLDVVPEYSRVSIQPSSGIYFDRPPQDGGTVFIPFAPQGGAGGPTNGLRAALEGRLRVDFRPDDPTPTLAILGFSTLFEPVASGAWLPGVPASPATPAAAQGAVAIGSASAFAMGQAALRDLALTIDASHPLVATGADHWAWPDGPFTGATPDVVELRVADGAIDFGLSITALTRDFVNEGSKRPLLLSTASRVRVIESGIDRIELRMPLNLEITKTLVEPVSSLPVRVRLDLDGRLVARNFIPEPGAAAAALAALGALALLARRRTRTRHGAGAGRELVQIAMLVLLIGVACPGEPLPGCSNADQCTGEEKCVGNICKNDGTCEDPTDCPDDQICKDGHCEDPAACDEPCEADGDCESGFCDTETGLCGECPPDECPGGCEETIEVGNGVTMFCGVAATCNPLPNGGTCIDCLIRDNGVDFVCFADGTACASFSLQTSCINGCGVVADDGTAIQCGDGCGELAGGVTCSGDCGGTVTGFGPISCGGCQFFIDLEPGDKGQLVLDKLSVGGDGSFDFLMGDFLGTPAETTITTNEGVGNAGIHLIAPIEDLLAEELGASGFETSGVLCDGQNTFTGGVLTVSPAAGATVICDWTNTSTSTGDVFSIDVLDPDELRPSQTFGLPPGNRISIAGSNGFVIMDPLTRSIPSVGNTDLSFVGGFNYQNLLGAMVVEKPTGDGADAIFAYKNTSGGSIQTYVPEILDFGATLLLNGTYRDAVHLGDDPSQTNALLTNSGGVQRFVWTDFGGGQIFPNTETALNNFTTAPGPISAFAFPAMTRIVAVTSGTPGKLVIGDPAQFFLAVVVVGDVGDDPRRIRCLDTVCAVSNFGSDSLTLATWDGATNLAITDTQAVGDGPIGIDLRALPGGNVAVASTGFNDSTYAITVVSSAGAVVASVSLPAPAGCVQPGHALWLGDAQQHLVLSCFGSDALAVFVPEIPTP